MDKRWHQHRAFRPLTGRPSISAFGIDPSKGDVLLADQGADTIKRLVYGLFGAALPPTLADTGAFADLTSLTPTAGIVPYDINLPFWSDNATISDAITGTSLKYYRVRVFEP